MKIKNRVAEKFWRFYRIPNRIDAMQEALGRIESRLSQASSPRASLGPVDHEFKVYSQWGEDGIIDHLVQSIPITNKTFVEFGVETYTEANTLFLLKHRNWNGLVIDGSPDNVESIRRGSVLWKYDLAADCSFITKDNINEIISRNGISGDIGLLSVDIDGNDYWVMAGDRLREPTHRDWRIQQFVRTSRQGLDPLPSRLLAHQRASIQHVLRCVDRCADPSGRCPRLFIGGRQQCGQQRILRAQRLHRTTAGS